MIDAYVVQVTLGKKRQFHGKITVGTPDDSGDMYIEAQSECGDPQGIYMRVEEARLLARVLLQASEEE